MVACLFTGFVTHIFRPLFAVDGISLVLKLVATSFALSILGRNLSSGALFASYLSTYLPRYLGSLVLNPRQACAAVTLCTNEQPGQVPGVLYVEHWFMTFTATEGTVDFPAEAGADISPQAPPYSCCLKRKIQGGYCAWPEVRPYKVLFIVKIRASPRCQEATPSVIVRLQPRSTVATHHLSNPACIKAMSLHIGGRGPPSISPCKVLRGDRTASSRKTIKPCPLLVGQDSRVKIRILQCPEPNVPLLAKRQKFKQPIDSAHSKDCWWPSLPSSKFPHIHTSDPKP